MISPTYALRRSLLFAAMLCLLLQPSLAKPLVVAHRGGVHIGAENRAETFRKAIALGVDAIEMDIHQSRDGHLMVIHDLTLKRCFQAEGRVDHMDRKALEELGVPSLETIIDELKGHCVLVIEVKQPKDGTRHKGIEKRLVALLKKKGVMNQSLVISFYDYTLRKLHKIEPKLQTGFLFSKPPADFVATKRELGIEYLGPRHSLVDQSFLDQAHRAGLKVNPWTVDGRENLKNFLKLDCDAITTNDPHILVPLVKPKWFVF